MADPGSFKSQTPSPAASRPAPGASAGRGCAAELHPCRDLANYLREYARQKPEAAALCCFGIGFVLGWKLKLW